MTQPDDVRMWARLQYILDDAIRQLPADDLGARIAWCKETGNHGITMHPGTDGLLEFQWGGRRLALVNNNVFEDEAYLQPILTDPVRDLPDDASELTDE